MKKILAITLIFLAYLPIQAQVNVSVALDSAAMLIGDQTTLHLNANHPNNVSIDYPALQNLGDFELVEMGEIDTLKKGNEIYLRQDIVITAFDSGFYQIPPQRFLVNKNGSFDTLYSAPTGMRVHLIEGDSTELAPIHSIKAQPYTKAEILRYLSGIGAIALIFGIAFYVLTRKRKKVTVDEPKVIIPAHVIANKKIEELKKAKLWQAGELKKYYSELTFIVREYLENRYQILALESTTDEILADLKQQDLSDTLKQKLREVLQSADLVKFAKGAPTAEFHENAMAVAEDFIAQTKIVIDLTKLDEDKNANV